jgi:hypothetical protein
MEFLFPEYRLDWFGAGPSSPNKTGALLALLFIAAWYPAFRFHWGYWLSLPLGLISGGLLLQTESRGALVAVACGMLLVIGCWLLVGRRVVGGMEGNAPSFPPAERAATTERCPPLKIWIRVSVGLLALVVLTIYSNQLGVNSRMTEMTSGGDESANVRVRLYSAGFQMIAAAPQGWGSGEAGDVYAQWYQVVGDSRSYLSLVNSHLTWMSDYGILFQFGYIAGWCAVLLMLWPVPWTPLRGISFAVWLALGICGFFSSVLTLPWLWVLPVLLLMLCLIQRFKLRVWPTMRHGMLTSLCVLGGFVGLRVVSASLVGDVLIVASPKRIEIGANPDAVLIVAPDRRIVGDKYGHTIRENLDVLSGATVLRNAEGLSGVNLSQYDALLFSGAVPSVALDGYDGRVVLLNPAMDVDDVAIASLGNCVLTVVVGSLGDWRRARVWGALADEHPNWEFIQLRGVADFVPNWTRFVVHDGGGARE